MARHRITRRIEWDAAHRITRHESKCASLHGHRYVAEIVVSAPQLDDAGRVIDFGVIKEKVGGWVDNNWDHTTLANYEDAPLRALLEQERAQGKRPPFYFDCEPTAENIAKRLFEEAEELLGAVQPALRMEEVRVWETPNCSAIWTRPK